MNYTRQIFLVFLLIPSSLLCQQAIVKYGVIKNKQNLNQTKSSLLIEIEKVSRDFVYTLKVNNYESSFEKEEVLESDQNLLIGKAANLLISQGTYYTNLTNKTFLYKTNNVYSPNYTVRFTIVTDWRLTGEQKYVSKFLCYKAIRSKTVINSKGTFQFPIEAWYSPEISLPFGPKEYGNLPGLILELKDANFTFYLKELNLNPKRVKVSRLSLEGSISEKEFKAKTELNTQKAKEALEIKN